jgi:class 3 adenylate cyclase
VPKCTTCEHENPVGARFCAACGTKLEASGGEGRKTVTIVFCDVVGSTTLAEHLDPESMRRALGRYFDAVRPALERHGGTVEKFIGDAVMAAFGIPRLHEDDALRALRAAAEARDAVAELGDELEEQLSTRLEARIGVTTGEVIAGDPSSGQSFVTGDAVNVAARLQQVAGPGQIVLDGPTRERAGDAIGVEDAGPLELKGKRRPVAAWRLLDVRDHVPPFTRSMDTAFIGRGREVGELHQALERSIESRSVRLCTVLGPPGIGKSRLVQEFVAGAADACRAVVGRCLPYGEGITYWPLAEIVRAVTGGGTRVEELFDGDEHAALVAERVAGAIGAADAPMPAEEIFWSFRMLFEALARERPLIAVVDELHWAEPTLFDLLDYLVTFSADAPILLVCIARPDLVESRPSWVAPRANATVISLASLANEEAGALAGSLARASGMPPADVEQALAAAEGNPLFLEQLLAFRAENADDERSVPPTIQALLPHGSTRWTPTSEL